MNEDSNPARAGNVFAFFLACGLIIAFGSDDLQLSLSTLALCHGVTRKISRKNEGFVYGHDST